MKREILSEAEMQELAQTTGHFKLNIPSSFENYQSGNGEGIWALVKTAELKEKVDNDTAGVFVAYAANTSFAYPDIVFGAEVRAEIRKGQRPVAIWEYLTNREEAAVRDKKVKQILIKKQRDEDSE